ncbi:hypothetical protein RJZ57_008420, partial [Blastomyces gilchristii]
MVKGIIGEPGGPFNPRRARAPAAACPSLHSGEAGLAAGVGIPESLAGSGSGWGLSIAYIKVPTEGRGHTQSSPGRRPGRCPKPCRGGWAEYSSGWKPIRTAELRP